VQAPSEALPIPKQRIEDAHEYEIQRAGIESICDEIDGVYFHEDGRCYSVP
jgi:hypothetical protein